MQIAGLFDAILFEEKNPHLIILPENTGYLDSLSKEKRRELVSRMSTKERVVILDSHYSYDSIKDKKVAVLEFETGGDETESYTKQLLVPAVEYIPRVIRVPGDLLLKRDWSAYFEEYISIEKGSETTIGAHENLRIGALFCSEVLTPTLYRATARLGANIFVNTASHSLLNSSENIYNQVVKFSKARAVESNRFFVQSGNSVPSFLIDNHGRMLGETARDKNSILYADVLLLENKTIATITGDAWVLVFLLLSIGGLRKGGYKKTRNV
jgi:apolipoprotein N-acyltransferase